MSGAPTAAEQARAVREASADRMAAGETWALVGAKWWAVFRAHAALDGGAPGEAPAPPPIDNAALAAERGGDIGELRMGLEENRDYCVVHERVWDLLHAWYGGGPAFKRRVVEIGLYKRTRLDLYPQLLRVCWAGEDGAPDGDDTELVSVSRKAGLAELAARLEASRPLPPPPAGGEGHHGGADEEFGEAGAAAVHGEAPHPSDDDDDSDADEPAGGGDAESTDDAADENSDGYHEVAGGGGGGGEGPGSPGAASDTGANAGTDVDEDSDSDAPAGRVLGSRGGGAAMHDSDSDSDFGGVGGEAGGELDDFLTITGGGGNVSYGGGASTSTAGGAEEEPGVRLWLLETRGAACESKDADGGGEERKADSKEAEAGADGGEAGADDADDAAAAADEVWTLLSGDDLLQPVELLSLAPGARVLAERRRADGTWPRAVVEKEWGSFEVADVIDARDTMGRWYESTVRDVKEGRVFVHFLQWSATWDEWIPTDSDRLAPRGTHTTGPHQSRAVSRWGRVGNAEGRPRERGAVGLTNLGNTCFMNSTLQCLSNTPLLTDYFISEEYRADLNRTNPLGWQGRVAESYAELLKELWSGKYTSVTPTTFKRTIGEFQPRFSGYQQQDSSELLSFLLDGLHEDLNRVRQKPATQAVESDGRPDAVVAREAWETHLKRNQSVVVDAMQGQLKSKLVCPVCGRVSITFDPFMFVSAPLPVESETTMHVALVPRDAAAEPPALYAVRVPKEGTVADLKRAVAAAASSSLERRVRASELLPADVFSSRVYRAMEDDSSLGSVQPNDQIYLYEVPGLAGPDAPDSDAEAEEEEPAGAAGAAGGEGGYMGGLDDMWGPMHSSSVKNVGDMEHPEGPRLVQVVHQRRKKNPYFGRYSNEREWTVENIGVPQVLALPRDTTFAGLAEAVARAVRPFTDARAGAGPAFSDDDDDEEAAPGAAGGDDSDEDEAEAAPLYELYVLDANASVQRGGGTPLDEEDPDRVVWEGEPYGAYDGYGAVPDGPDYGDSDEEYPPEGAPGSTLAGTARVRRVSVGVRWLQQFDYEGAAAEWDTMARDASAEAAADEAGRVAEESIDLADCLRVFTEEETLSEDDPWYCRQCKEHRRATKKFDLWKLPDVLVVHLKRFSFSRLHRDKISTLVDFPLEGLDLSEFCANPDDSGAPYDLYAVSNHYGGLGGGHYTAYARNLLDGKWYDLDDSRVSPIRPEEVHTTAAYVLFYVRRGAIERGLPPRAP